MPAMEDFRFPCVFHLFSSEIMASAILVLCACGTALEAETIARALVNERIAACVNILLQVTSVYRWQGKTETAPEHLLFIKTAPEQEQKLQQRLLQLHSYDTPEIVVLPIESGFPGYLAWLREQVSD